MHGSRMSPSRAVTRASLALAAVVSRAAHAIRRITAERQSRAVTAEPRMPFARLRGAGPSPWFARVASRPLVARSSPAHSLLAASSLPACLPAYRLASCLPARGARIPPRRPRGERQLERQPRPAWGSGHGRETVTAVTAWGGRHGLGRPSRLGEAVTAASSQGLASDGTVSPTPTRERSRLSRSRTSRTGTLRAPRLADPFEGTVSPLQMRA